MKVGDLVRYCYSSNPNISGVGIIIALREMFYDVEYCVLCADNTIQQHYGFSGLDRYWFFEQDLVVLS